MSRNLGRGLSALLGEENETEQTAVQSGVKTVAVADLEPSPFQPRHTFDEEALRDLVESVKTKGVIQPLIVRKHAGKYEIIGGERRWRAAQQAGLREVPVLVKDFSDKEAMEVALIENLQRQDLNALEEAEGYRRLMDEFSNTQEELAQAVGKSRSHVANTMRLLGLPQPVKTMLETGKLSSGHARALLTAKDPEALAQTVVARGLNVRQTEKLAQADGTPKKQKAAPKKSDRQIECDELAQDLSRVLGMTVSIRPKARGGELVLTYSTLEELDKLIARLSAKKTENDEITAVADEEIIENGDDVDEVIFDDSFGKDADIITNDD